MATITLRCYSSENTSASLDATAQITLSECLVLDVPATSPQEVIDIAGYVIGSAYPLAVPVGYNVPKLSSYSINSDSATKWTATLNYIGTKFEGGGGGGGTDEVIRVKWGVWTEEEVMESAYRIKNGIKNTLQKVTNQANDPFDPPFMVTHGNPTLRATVRTSTLTLSHIEKIGSVNSDAFTLCGIPIPKWCAYLESVEYENVGNTEYDMIFQFKLKLRQQNLININGELAGQGQRGFTTLLLNSGMNEIVGGTYDEPTQTVSGGTKRPIWLANNEKVSSPVLLDLAGKQQGASYTPVYKEFLPYPEFNSGTLPPALTVFFE